jgi:ABC-type sugar transport system ATPase subunit
LGFIEFNHVSKSFGRTEVIPDISLDIRKGELIVFVGPSGCGKSTLLRLLAGLEDVSSGTISINGEDVTHRQPKERNIAMVFQNYALYPHMTVEENIAFSMKLSGVPKEERQKRVLQAAETLGLGELLARKPRELSGGQRQRVAMGRAIVRDPQVFLMDEPLSNLDAKLRNHMRVEIRQLQRRLGTTMIYVTHDQVEAMTMADRIVILEKGIVRQFGTPQDVYCKPANTFVADFIGSPSINLFTAERTAHNVLRLGGSVDLTVAPECAQALGDGKRYTVGVRPEHISVNTGQTGSGVAAWSSGVTLNELLGGESLLHASLGTESVRVKMSGREAFAPGESVNLSFNAASVHVFTEDGSVCLCHSGNI